MVHVVDECVQMQKRKKNEYLTSRLQRLHYFDFWPRLNIQGCCLTGARAPGAPKLRVRATKVFFKEPEWAPKHGVFIPIQSVQRPQSSQEIDQKLIHTIN